jgi:hypothetical protein
MLWVAKTFKKAAGHLGESNKKENAHSTSMIAPPPVHFGEAD